MFKLRRLGPGKIECREDYDRRLAAWRYEREFSRSGKALIICPGHSLNNFNKDNLKNYEILIGINRACNYSNLFDYFCIGNTYNFPKIDWNKYTRLPMICCLEKTWNVMIEKEGLQTKHFDRVSAEQLYYYEIPKPHHYSFHLGVFLALYKEYKDIDIVGLDCDPNQQSDWDGYVTDINVRDRIEKNFDFTLELLNEIKKRTKANINRL